MLVESAFGYFGTWRIQSLSTASDVALEIVRRWGEPHWILLGHVANWCYMNFAPARAFTVLKGMACISPTVALFGALQNSLLAWENLYLTIVVC